MKHFKIQLLFNRPKKIQQLWPVAQKIQILEIQNPKKLRWSLGLFDAWLFVANYTKPGKFVAKLEKI